jgi:hypothetical protein
MSDRKSSPPPDATLPTLPPAARVPTSEFGALEGEHSAQSQRALDDAVMEHAHPNQRILYRRINELSDALFDPNSSLNSTQRNEKLDELIKQFSMIGRQIGNLQMQVGTLVHDQRMRREEDETNWKLIRVQVSGIRSDVQNLELAFEKMKSESEGRWVVIEKDVAELFEHQQRTDAVLAEIREKLEGRSTEAPKTRDS